MAIHIQLITQEEHDHILVNGKTVRRDMDGRWVANHQLTFMEALALQNFIESMDAISHSIRIQEANYEKR